VRVAGCSFDFVEEQVLHTENAYSFTVHGFAGLAARAGWKLERSFVSPAPAFAVVVLSA
jgi:hypothetical protein